MQKRFSLTGDMRKMITNQRRYEVIEACKGLINSPNVSELGKHNAKIKIEEMYSELILFDT